MNSPYVSRLSNRRDAASSSVERATLTAEIGMYYARTGKFEAAERIAEELRAEFGDGKSGAVSIMLMALEGLVSYFKDLSTKSHDRIVRAQVLSVAARSSRLTALMSAWLAHIDFNLGRYAEMSRAIDTCLGAIDPVDHDALCRLSLTLGDVFLLCEDRKTAGAWYKLAHDYAVSLGDRASIGALTYNQAALGVFFARISALDAPIDTSWLASLVGAVKSAINYQSVARLESLQSLLDSAQVSLKVLQADFSGATALLEPIIASGSRVAFSSVPILLCCDLILCYAKIGRLTDARTALDNISLESIESESPDDRAICYASLAEGAALCGMKEVADGYRSMSVESLNEHRRQVAPVRVAVSGLVDPDKALRLRMAR